MPGKGASSRFSALADFIIDRCVHEIPWNVKQSCDEIPWNVKQSCDQGQACNLQFRNADSKRRIANCTPDPRSTSNREIMNVQPSARRAMFIDANVFIDADAPMPPSARRAMCD